MFASLVFGTFVSLLGCYKAMLMGEGERFFTLADVGKRLQSDSDKTKIYKEKDTDL